MTLKCAPALLFAALCCACTTAAGPATSAGPEFLSSESTRSLKLPFSDAVRAGDLVFLSGQVGNLPGTLRLPEGGIGPETRQTMDNIRAVLVANDLDMSDLVKCTVFLADMSEWSAFNAIYIEYFSGSPPARSALGVDALALGARLEVECIAYAGSAPAAGD